MATSVAAAAAVVTPQAPGARAIRVAVIGAGAAGVACARRLLECGARCTLFDQASSVGGVWGEEDGVVWPSLTSNLPTCIMQYPDTPFPGSDQSPSFVGKREMGRYIQHCFKTHVEPYARTGALTTALGCSVTSVSRVLPKTTCSTVSDDKSSWAVKWTPTHSITSSNEDGERVVATGGSAEFDAVVVANGHYSTPHDPVYEGAEVFPGLRIHSCEYSKHSPEEWAGKRVVVVGAKASGTDIARELLAAGADVSVADRACEASQVLTEPPLEWHPPIRRLLQSGGVVFEDGVTADAVDVVINCTGYDYDFPFLDDSCEVQVNGRCVGPLYKQVFHVDHPSLVFVGLQWIIIPFPLFDFQARLAARVLTGAVQLPPRDERARSHSEELAALDDPQHAHKLGMRQFDYCRDLARMGGFFTDEEDRRLRLVEAIYKEVGTTRPKLVGGDDWYRKVKYEMIGDAAFVVKGPGETPPVRHDVPTVDSSAPIDKHTSDAPDPWD